MATARVTCPQCHADRTSEFRPGEAMTACSSCGHVGVNYEEVQDETVLIIDAVLGKHDQREPKVDGHRRGVETVSGTAFDHGTGHKVEKYRLRDRNEDRYVEVVVDLETGETLHDVEEPLHKHTEHGTARPKP